MSLNATLLIQMTVFAVVVLFSMKFIWPMIMEAIEERNKNISDGLAAAEQGQKKLSEAETCLLYTSPSPRDATLSRMPSSA